jgi:hypothetical protein
MNLDPFEPAFGALMVENHSSIMDLEKIVRTAKYANHAEAERIGWVLPAGERSCPLNSFTSRHDSTIFV